MSASTHSLPLSMLAQYLTLDLNCTVALLGIQPGSNSVSDNISPEVSRALQEIIDELDGAFQIIHPSPGPPHR